MPSECPHCHNMVGRSLICQHCGNSLPWWAEPVVHDVVLRQISMLMPSQVRRRAVELGLDVHEVRAFKIEGRREEPPPRFIHGVTEFDGTLVPGDIVFRHGSEWMWVFKRYKNYKGEIEYAVYEVQINVKAETQVTTKQGEVILTRGGFVEI